MVRTGRHSLCCCSRDTEPPGDVRPPLSTVNSQHFLGISPGLTLQRLSGAQDRRGTTWIHSSERRQSGHTPAPHHRNKSTNCCSLVSLLHRAARSHPSSAQGLLAPLTSLPLTSFCTILEARIFSMILASSSGGSWGQETRALCFWLITHPWHSPSTERLLAPLPVPQPGRDGTGSWESCAWGAPAGCEGVGAASPATLTLCLSSSGQPGHSSVRFAVWVLPATPGQPDRVESLPEKRRELGHFCPWTQGRNYAKIMHIPPPRHSPCHILVMPWQFYSPTVLYGPRAPGEQAARLSGPATCHSHTVICS